MCGICPREKVGEREREWFTSGFLGVSEFRYADWWKSVMSRKSDSWYNIILSANDRHNLHIFLLPLSKFLLTCGTILIGWVCVCFYNVEVHKVFVKIECCHFTWTIVTPYLYPFNPKFRKIQNNIWYSLVIIKAKVWGYLLKVVWSTLFLVFEISFFKP